MELGAFLLSGGIAIESEYKHCSGIRLHTERLILRDHIPQDVPTHHSLLSDLQAMYYLQDIRSDSLETSERNLADSISQIGKTDRTLYFLRIEQRDSGHHVGEIGYTVTDFTPLGKLVHMGYFLYPIFWNHGIATEALREVQRFAFEENEVFRISTGCLAENRASERVMQKCGMICEAEKPKMVWHNGSLKDRVEYRLLLDEWNTQNN